MLRHYTRIFAHRLISGTRVKSRNMSASGITKLFLPNNCPPTLSTPCKVPYQPAKRTLGSTSAVSFGNDPAPSIDAVTFEAVCSETLEALFDYFEELIEDTPSLKAADVTYGDGVLTVNLGSHHGTYVINRQSPNRQIWLSSPTSGPKRYDFVSSPKGVCEGFWVYKHDGIALHELLQKEITSIVAKEVKFNTLLHSRPEGN